MSIYHHKTVFSKQLGEEIFYKYCPDTIEQKDCWGEFKFNFNDWQPLITVAAEPKGEIIVYIDEKCVNKLTYKIKEHFNEYNKLPQDILWIA